MARLVSEIATYLQSESIGTVATDIFYDQFPDISNSPAVCIYDKGGPPGEKFSPVAQSAIQIMVRASGASGFETARNHAAKIYNLLHGAYGVSLTNNYVMKSEAFGLPQSIGQDGRQRHLVSANYEVTTYATTSSGATSSGVGGDKDPNLN